MCELLDGIEYENYLMQKEGKCLFIVKSALEELKWCEEVLREWV